jgi:ribosome-associated translation inhibitor RaiA
MRVDLIVKNIRKTRVLGDVIEKDIAKLARHLHMFKDENVLRLEVKLEKSMHTDDCSGTMILSIPRKVLRVSAESGDKYTCVNTLTKLLIKHLDKVKGQLEKHISHRKKGLAELTCDRVCVRRIEDIDISQ